jgi:UDP-N-acetylglucosamine 2-epimerase (non-hydrolysing)
MLACSVVGARPNFMKIAPVFLELKRRRIPQLLVHTGQHYDANMSQVFFEELGLPVPDIYLGVGSDTHARQTARIMVLFEEVCRKHRPDLVMVGGDVNSTIATALVAAKEHIPVAHVEAGLRSFDRTMPEEINRVATDHLAELLFTTEESADKNLRSEGISPENIHFVGNCMVDTLLKHVKVAIQQTPWQMFGVKPSEYVLVTLHRPSNVDDSKTLRVVMSSIKDVSRRLPVLFPVHPRTRSRLATEKIGVAPAVNLTDPLPYLTFIGLMAKARFVMTDSGGIQEETTVLGVPCLTLRWNTERPVTIARGTNRLVGTDRKKIKRCVDIILAGKWPDGGCPPLWDGEAGQRIADVVEFWVSQRGAVV